MMKWKRPLAVLMAVICCIYCATPSIVRAAEANEVVENEEGTKQTVNYVALGDSITAGSGTYVDTVAQYLTQKHGSCQTTNLAVNGWESADLLDALSNPSHAMYASMSSALANADYITLDIGSNDLLVGTMESIAESFGCGTDQVVMSMMTWSQKVQNAKGFSGIFVHAQAIALVAKVQYRLYRKVPSLIRQFESNYANIITTVQRLAPNAKIYVGNFYNPYTGAPSLRIGGYTMLNLDSYAKTHLGTMNRIIANRSKDCTVVDLYHTINSSSYIKGDVANYNLDPHPNQAGQTAIANKFIAAMK